VGSNQRPFDLRIGYSLSTGGQRSTTHPECQDRCFWGEIGTRTCGLPFSHLHAAAASLRIQAPSAVTRSLSRRVPKYPSRHGGSSGSNNSPPSGPGTREESHSHSSFHHVASRPTSPTARMHRAPQHDPSRTLPPYRVSSSSS